MPTFILLFSKSCLSPRLGSLAEINSGAPPTPTKHEKKTREASVFSLRLPFKTQPFPPEKKRRRTDYPRHPQKKKKRPPPQGSPPPPSKKKDDLRPPAKTQRTVRVRAAGSPPMCFSPRPKRRERKTERRRPPGPGLIGQQHRQLGAMPAAGRQQGVRRHQLRLRRVWGHLLRLEHGRPPRKAILNTAEGVDQGSTPGGKKTRLLPVEHGEAGPKNKNKNPQRKIAQARDMFFLSSVVSALEQHQGSSQKAWPPPKWSDLVGCARSVGHHPGSRKKRPMSRGPH